MRLVALIFFLLAPTYAFAMPQAIPLIIAAVGTYSTVAAIALTIGYAIYGSAQQRKAERAQRDAYNASLQDRTITRVATDASQVYVYGRAKVGSAIVAMFTSGDKDQYKHLVCVHAAHECDAIEEIYIAGKAVGPLDGSGFATSGAFSHQTTEAVVITVYGGTTVLPVDPVENSIVAVQNNVDGNFYVGYDYDAATRTLSLFSTDVTSVQYAYVKNNSTVRVSKHLGAVSDPADATLLAELPGMWSSNAVLRGYCYTVIRLDLNQAEFQGGIPDIQAVIRGKKLYDVRTGLTSWSQNNALAIYDYLTSELCSVSASDLPVSQFIAAANVCDEQYWFGSRYTFNGTISADEDQKSVLEKMAQSMAGGIVSTTWDVYAGTYVAPILALNQTDIIGQIAITPGISDADLYNGIRGQYTGSETEYVTTDFAPYQNASYVTADGGEQWTDLDFPYTDALQRVQNLARIFVEDQRNGYTVKAEFSLKAWSVKVGQRVTLTSPFFGWSAKVFRVTDKSYSPNSAVELTLKEDDPSIWDFADAVTVDETPNTNLPNPFVIAPLASLTCQSGTDVLLMAQDGSIISRILVTWPQATTQSVTVNGQIEIEASLIGSGVWQRTTVFGGDTQAYVSPVVDGGIYTVRARCFNPYLNIRSDWTYAASHQVIGKTAPPSDVPWFLIENNTLTWGTVGDIDLAGYRIKFHYGLNRSWGDASPLHDGLLTQNPFTPNVTPQGPITLMIKAVDTTGNESGTAAVIQTQLGDVIVANVVETFDFKAAGYSGTVTGGALASGSLFASGIAAFFQGGGASFFDYDSAPFFVDNFSAMVYETSIFTPSKAESGSGSQMTLLTAITGDALNIEYRVCGSKEFFPALDTEPFFDADDTAPFYEAAPMYQTWPGQVGTQNIQYQFRFTTGQSATQGVIDTCTAVIDVPDVTEKLNDVVISAAGTRLPITKTYSVIANLQMTLQADGGTAVKVEIADKNATLGPLVKCRDSSGALTSGKIDATVQGY